MIEINDLIGKPFCSDPENAYGPNCYSCYGLLWEVYKRFGIDIPKTNISVISCREASNLEINQHVSKYWQEIKRPEIPCGVHILSTHPDYPNHIGVYIDTGKMIHTTMFRNVEVARISNWKQKIIGYYRYVGYNHSDL